MPRRFLRNGHVGYIVAVRAWPGQGYLCIKEYFVWRQLLQDVGFFAIVNPFGLLGHIEDEGNELLRGGFYIKFHPNEFYCRAIGMGSKYFDTVFLPSQFPVGRAVCNTGT